MRLIIRRESRVAYSGRSIQIFINNEFVGKLRNGGCIEAPLKDGHNSVHFRIGSKTTAIASVCAGGEDSCNIICWTNGGGVEFYSDSPAVQKQVDAQGGKNTTVEILLFLLVATLVTAALLIMIEPGVILFIPT